MSYKEFCKINKLKKYKYYNIHWNVRILSIIRISIFAKDKFDKVCIRFELSWGWD